MPVFVTTQETTLLSFLRETLSDWKQSTIRDRLRQGCVLVNGKVQQSGGWRLFPGDRVELAPPGKSEKAPLPVLYLDDYLVAVDKPAGLLSVATEREKAVTAWRIMSTWLAEKTGLDRLEEETKLHAAHRLDRDTSGILLFARGREIREKVIDLWSTAEKTYLAITDGVPAEESGVIDQPLYEDKGLFVRIMRHPEARRAVTHYKVVDRIGGRAMIEVKLETGRKHQIRVHLASIGCPVVGDLRYGVAKDVRLGLHAWKLHLVHPVDLKILAIESPLPPVFMALFNKRRTR